jgi:hypothetical protein
LEAPILDPKIPQNASFFRKCSVLVVSTISFERAFITRNRVIYQKKVSPKVFWALMRAVGAH